MEQENYNNLRIINILDFIRTEDGLQHNLKKLHESLGQKFIIKLNQHLIITYFFLVKTYTNEREFFRLSYDGEIINGKYFPKKINNSSNIHPLIIDFIDPITAQLNENTYINNIHRTEHITGSEMIETAIKINEILGVKKTYLHDKASIIHNDIVLNLSLFKLIEKGKTFYSKFGFDFDINNINNYYLNKFDSVDQLKNKVEDLINKIRNIKTSELIRFVKDTLDVLDLVIKNQDFENFSIHRAIRTIKDVQTDVQSIENPKSNLITIVDKLSIMISILRDIKNEYFYQYLIDCFNHPEKCKYYNEILQFLTLDDIYMIKYKEKEIINNFDLYFKHLNAIKNDHYYVYQFK
jgi:hypothetical protein